MQWNDWRWQLRNRIRTAEALERILPLTPGERAALRSGGPPLPLAVTPYYLSLVDPNDPDDPIRRTVVPTGMELLSSPGESEDPLHEEHDSPVPGLIHRYPDRVLVLLTDSCSTYCRYCTRSRRVGEHGVPVARRAAAVEYIRNHPEVRDVLLSGGDPLTLAEGELEPIIRAIRAIPHVEIIRIGTKVPAVLPMRITPELVRMLRRYHPLFVSIHATHPRELTGQMVRACTRLADAGIPLGSQTVLLKGVNDTVKTMTALMHGLLRSRVRPYYLYQCDPIRGSGHFRTSVQSGLDIIRGLRGHTSGYAVPTYVIDAPGGGGKIPLLPDYVRGWTESEVVLENYQGRIFTYPDAGGVEQFDSRSLL
jgi:lysine 2,3-aminomutase